MFMGRVGVRYDRFRVGTFVFLFVTKLVINFNLVAFLIYEINTNNCIMIAWK
jgi:hypothetical protein